MAYINTLIKRATAAPRFSTFCSAATARPAVKNPVAASMPCHMRDVHECPGSRKLTSSVAMAPKWSRTFASGHSYKKNDVPRTASGEVQKQNNFASEVGNTMQEVAPGGDPAKSASSGKEKEEQTKQERYKGGSK